MASIHESLHQTDMLSEIDFNAYLQKLTQMLANTFLATPDKVDFQIDCPGLRLSIDIANPLGLVLNELISNSLKYAFPNGKKGTISIHSSIYTNSDIELVLEDNGIGLPEGMDWRNTKSPGLRLVKDIIERQLDGAIEFNHQNGACCKMRFNLNSGNIVRQVEKPGDGKISLFS